MTRAAVGDLDLRPVPETERFARALAVFDALPENGSVLLTSETGLRPLFERLCRDRADVLRWTPMLCNPGEHRAEVARLAPKESVVEIGEYFARDHDEIDAIFAYLRADLQGAVQGAGVPAADLLRQFREFDRRLERHMRWEEQVLFPAVEEKSPALVHGPGRVMRSEHEEIRTYRATAGKELRAAPPSEAGLARASEALEAALRILLDHNRKEEGIYYPLADQMFPGPEAAGLLERVRAMR